MKMKELEERTGVGRETIRFYIKEGLLDEPQRPKRNVAVYNEAHVARVSVIKRLQQERFLPLTIIKDMVAQDAELDAEHLPSLLGLEFLLSARFSNEQSRQPIALSAVTKATGIDLSEIEEMDRIGMVSIAVGGTLSKQDADMVGLWGQLKAAGFDEANGYSVSVLSRYVETAQDMAEKDVESFYTNVPRSVSTTDATSMAETAINVTNEIIGRLRLRAIIQEVAARNAAELEEAVHDTTPLEDRPPSEDRKKG